MTPLTPEAEQQIRERAEKATPGPWYAADGWRGGTFAKFLVQEPGELNGDGRYVGLPEDTEFIANARTDIPALLSTIDSLRAELAREREKVQEIRKEILFVSETTWRFAIRNIREIIDRIDGSGK